jgi:Formate dehydrogenase N, transmembrane
VLGHGDHPEWYGLPSDPRVPWAVTLWKQVMRPLGMLAIFGSVLAAFGHYLTRGPMPPGEDADRGDA